MNALRMKRPSPAFVVAMIALFVALGGTAGAVATQAVPLAKRGASGRQREEAGRADVGAALGEGCPGCSGRCDGSGAREHGGEPHLGQSGTFRALGQRSGVVHRHVRRWSEGDRRRIREPGRDGSLLDTGPTSDGSGWSIYLVEASGSGAAVCVVQAICLR